ncbi:hypothetical protein GCM10010199_50020 [Dactylosporangium roseum]
MTGPERSGGAGHHGLRVEVRRPERSGGRVTVPERNGGAGHHGLGVTSGGRNEVEDA